MTIQLRWLAVILVAALSASGCNMLARVADRESEEQVIRTLDAEWVAAVATKDAAAVADFYASDGSVLPPNGPEAKGPEAVTKFWQGLFGLPNFQLTFAPTQVVVAKSGDLAYDIGTYSLSFDADQGPVQDAGKYVVVWKKVRGQWKVAADMFSSNAPAP
jgi:uncharacterized protein (TIGR02246 family)